MAKLKEYSESHEHGMIQIEKSIYAGGYKGDFGIQISKDGRVWICLNGITILRFKPLSEDILKNMKKLFR